MNFYKGAIQLIIVAMLMFSGSCIAADSNKAKLKQMLDNGHKPQAASSIPSNFLTGLWVGYFDYDERTSDTPPANTFSIVFEQTPNNVSAIILEPAASGSGVYAQLAEVIDASIQGKTLNFTKRYQSGNTIQYSLLIDVENNVLTGQWNIGDNLSGPVKLWQMDVREMKKL